VNKAKFNESLRHKILTRIYRTGDKPAIDYAHHSFLEAPLDLEALGLSLHSVLVNPALHRLLNTCPEI